MPLGWDIKQYILANTKDTKKAWKQIARLEKNWAIADRAEELSVVHRPRLFKKDQFKYQELCDSDPIKAKKFFDLHRTTIPVPPLVEELERAEEQAKVDKILKVLEFVRLPADHPKKKLKRRI